MGILDNLKDKIGDRGSNISVTVSDTENKLPFLEKLQLGGGSKLKGPRTGWERNSQGDKGTSREKAGTIP